MDVRCMVVRLVELRARRFSDPAQRLQFLQRTITPGHAIQANHKRVLARILMVTFTMGLVVVSGAWVRRALTVVSAAPMARKPRAIVAKNPLAAESVAVRRVWMVESN